MSTGVEPFSKFYGGEEALAATLCHKAAEDSKMSGRAFLAHLNRGQMVSVIKHAVSNKDMIKEYGCLVTREHCFKYNVFGLDNNVAWKMADLTALETECVPETWSEWVKVASESAEFARSVARHPVSFKAEHLDGCGNQFLISEKYLIDKEFDGLDNAEDLGADSEGCE